MADTVTDLVGNVKTEAGFDVVDATALGWLNRRWRTMVSEARAYRKTVSVATTSTESFYAFSPIEAYSFEVGAIPYTKARRPDIYASAQGSLAWEGPGGWIVEDADSTGVRGINLFPNPGSGLAITSFAAVMPADLTQDTAGNNLLAAVLEGDFHDELVAGAVATGLKRVRRRPDLAVPYDQEFIGGVERLRLRQRRRYRGAMPSQIRVLGMNA